MDYSPGDIIHVHREVGSDRFYFIEGACLGGEGQRSVVAVICADERSLPACEDAGEQFERREVHHIPMALFEAAIGSENTTIYDEFESMENPVYK
jgi:hypothetical protein